MTSTALALPMTGDSNTWNEQEKALVKAAGLVRSEGRGQNAREFLADRPTVEAFLAHCRRTGLDPIARQIYAIYRGGKWGIQISIDGARLVAERTGRYEGQTPTQWTDDGVTWVDVWLKESEPRAARVGVYRTGFREPLYAVANWDSYVVTKDEWVGGQKTGNVVVSDMWKKFGPLMLGKCAEMLALRKAFPQDLSGLYSTEEMQQVGGEAPAAPAPQAAAEPVIATVVEDARDWVAKIAAVVDVAGLTDLYREAQQSGSMATPLSDAEDAETVEAALWRRKSELERAPQEVVDVEPEPREKARDWVAEAKRATTSKQVIDLSREALVKDAPQTVIDQLADIAAELDTAEKEQGGDWAAAEQPPADEWSQESGAGKEQEK